uniref:LRRCT domain-containing protein n=2 Tax=Meleagris gallopavo TaxID=9103 RepID=G1MV71_MELGA
MRREIWGLQLIPLPRALRGGGGSSAGHNPWGDIKLPAHSTSTMALLGHILPPPLPLLLLLLLPYSHAASCHPQPNATHFICTDPALNTFPSGLPPTTVAISVEFTAVTTISPSALAGLPHLQELHLSSNHLAVLPEALLQPVPTLRILDLTDNLLPDLPAGIFHHSIHLRHLVLQGNLLQALQPAWFMHLTQLHWLNLAGNALLEVPPAALRPLRSLRSLDLAHNRLHHLHADTFMGLQKLERLDLEGNQLRALPPTLFMPTPALRLLFLQSNTLQVLPDGIFSPLLHLRVLDLAHNHLQALQLPPRSPGPPLSLDISGNPWACECSLLALLQDAAPQLIAARDTRCASPAQHRGEEVAAVSQAGCDHGGDKQSPLDH